MGKQCKRRVGGALTQAEATLLAKFALYMAKFGEARLYGESEPGWMTVNDIFVQATHYERQLLKRLSDRTWLQMRPFRLRRKMYRISDTGQRELALYRELCGPNPDAFH